MGIGETYYVREGMPEVVAKSTWLKYYNIQVGCIPKTFISLSFIAALLFEFINCR